MNSYQRAVTRYLRDNYDIRPRPTRYGRHPALEFEFAGVRKVVTLNAPGHPGRNLLALKFQDIRRELGAPSVREKEKTKMQIKDMLPQGTNETLIALTRTNTEMLPPLPEPAPGPVFVSAKTACYVPGLVRLLVGAMVAKRLFGKSAVTVDKIDTDHWVIRADASKRKPRFIRSNTAGFLELNFRADGMDRFGVIVVEAWEEGSSLHIRSDPAVRASAALSDLKARKIEFLPVPSSLEKTKSPRDRMLAVLREIRELEEIGTHRLIRTTGARWQWDPAGEVVKLEDKE
jgi:hypothetical protein